jgi:uncharacterized protein GlcG (DUF336 family)
MSLDLATAKAITAGAQAFGSSSDLKPLTVVVLDAGGHVTSVERQDGASNQRFEVAYGKANGALALGMGSRALMNRAEAQSYFVTAVGASIRGPLIPVPGGVILRDGAGAIVGAVGISGDSSDNDEAAAVAGAQAAGLAFQVD